MKVSYLIVMLSICLAAPPDEMDGCLGKIRIILALCTMDGWLSSPGYSDGAYPRNINCSYRIQTFKGFVIHLRFADFKLEVSNSCSRDKIIIREPQKNGKDVILTYCGSEIPQDYYAKDNVLEINFVTDRIGSDRGFRFQWNVFVARDFCKGILCRNRRCAEKSAKCNGEDDCMDGTDEEGCDYKTDSNETCGIQKISHKARLTDKIVGGMDSRAGSWPWMADLQDVSVFPSGHICGGTLLNAQWVITAALCFKNLRRASDWRVKLGNHKKFRSSEGEQVRYITRIVFHGMENAKTGEMSDDDLMNDDIALLKLSAPVKMTRFVQRACLPNDNTELRAGTKCYSTGYGETRGSGNSDVLKQVTVPILANKTCEGAFGYKFKKGIMICAGNTGTINALCSGDNGGPLMCQLEENLWTLMGVATLTPSRTTGTSLICGLRNTPSVFHKVSTRVKWIRETIET